MLLHVLREKSFRCVYRATVLTVSPTQLCELGRYDYATWHRPLSYTQKAVEFTSAARMKELSASRDYTYPASVQGSQVNDEAFGEVMLNVLRCQLTY